MAKINLLTIHWGNCYGAVLQTYATCKILEKLGHQVRVINLVPKDNLKKYLNIKSWAFILLDFQFYLFKHRFFPSLTRKMYSIKSSYLPPADLTIVGSDQVWNRGITGELSDAFFLTYLPPYAKRISLSSSFGKSVWEEDLSYTQHIKCALSKFNAISVREDSGAKICKEIFDIDAIQLIDPTLALNDYGELIKKESKEVNEVFSFLYKPSQETDKIVQCVSEEIGAKCKKRNIFEILFKSSPIHWLRRIYDSKFIVTDSFHCLAFCLIFQKQFIIVCANEKQFTRLYSLLKLLGLEDRFVENFDSYNIKNLTRQKIDYTIIHQKLNTESIRYRDYIKEVLLENSMKI